MTDFVSFSLIPTDSRFFNDREELSNEFVDWLSTNVGDLQGRWGTWIEGRGWDYDIISTTGITDHNLSFTNEEDAQKFRDLRLTTTLAPFHIIRTVKDKNETDYEHKRERFDWLLDYLGPPATSSGWFLNPKKRVWRYRISRNAINETNVHLFTFREANDAMAFKLASGGGAYELRLGS